MEHFLGGPADGYVQLMDEKDHPFAASMNTDTDSYYAMEYRVGGQRVGYLILTDDDVIGRWHQRSSAYDFMTGTRSLSRLRAFARWRSRQPPISTPMVALTKDGQSRLAPT